MDIAQHLREILDATPDAMIAVDETGTIVWVNAQCDRVFGYGRGELVGQSHEVLVPEPSRAAHRHHRKHFFAQASARPMGEGRQLEGRRRDGSTFPAEISLSVSSASDGTIVLAAVRDVTNRKEAERQLRHAQQLAEAAELANRAKSDFLSRVSHELRTPLNAILGFAQLLQREALTESQREDVDQINDAGQHLLGLIDDVLDLSAVESGHLTVSAEPVEVLELVDDVTSLVAPIARTRTVRIAVHGEPDLHVVADRQRLKQVLLNLLSNAIKYNVTGGRVGVVWGESGADRLRIDVTDSGPGIAPELIGRVFRPFDRLGAERSEVEGAGLGLALTKGLVERMGGTITVTSALGEGTTFSLDLPLAGPPAPRLEPEEPRDISPKQVGGRFMVLHVEDNVSNLRLLRRIIELRPGVELVAAMQGRLALDLAREQRPDLILLDLHLPDMDGQEVLAELRAQPATCDIPVVVVSADASPGRRQQLLEGGATDYLTKPLDVHQILDVIDEVVDLRASQTPGG